MSSMTDIVFLLLIFFMITSTMVHPNAIKLLIPRKTTKKVVVEKYLDIRVTSTGRYYVEGKRIGVDNIESDMKAAFSRNDKTIVKLRTDKNASTGNVARILDIAEAYGVKVILDIK